MIRLALLAVLAWLPILAHAQGIVSASAPTATTFSSSAPSGSNGYVCKVDGCRVDLGTGSTDYLYSTGTAVRTGGDFQTGANLTVGASGTNSIYGNLFGQTVSYGATTLGTCASGLEGYVRRLTGTGGTNTGSETRLCVCVSSGAASPVYSWRNLISGTAGNSTTCNP